MGDVQGYTRRFYMSRIREATFGTAVALNYYLNLEGGAMLRPSVATINDANTANNLESPRKQVHLEKSLDATLSVSASPVSVGWGAAFAMGSDSVVDIATGSGTNDTLHQFVPMAAATAHYSATVEDHASGATAAAATDLKHAGVCVEGFDVSWGESGLVQNSIVLAGSGITSAAGDQTESGLFGPICYFPANKTTVFIKACSTEHTAEWKPDDVATYGWTPPLTAGTHNTYSGFTDIGSDISNATLSFRNNFTRRNTAGTSSGAGIYGVAPYRNWKAGGNGTAATLSMTWHLNSDTDDYVWSLLNGTDSNNAEYSIVIECVSDWITATGGAYYGFAFMLPCAGIVQTPGSDGGPSDMRQDSITFFAKTGLGTASANLWPIYGYLADLNTSAFAAAS